MKIKQMNEQFEEIKTIIDNKLSIEQKSDLDTEFLNSVAFRVAELMESNMELFFNHLYRMDIDERKVHTILNSNSDESVYISIAKIIIERQRKRLETKKKYKQDKIEGWDEY
jgi:hypothetical protein